MFIFKIFFSLSILFFTTTTAHAAVWYDKLPESGERVPESQHSAQPNYSGNVNSQAENQLDFSEENTPSSETVSDSQSGFEQEKVTTSNYPNVAQRNTRVGIVVGAIILLCVGGWFIVKRPKQK